MNFAAQVIQFHRELKPTWQIPSGIELIYPYDQEETFSVFSQFYYKYFSDNRSRAFLFGINPGRFGAGVTGIPFTDPVILENTCNIVNSFRKRNELSSLFVYEMIEAMGGPDQFYSKFYITSICPLGFLTKGKNCNYYDDKNLQDAVYPHIIKSINTQLKFGADKSRAYSMGQGKNFTFLKNINNQFKWFDEIIPLPHPRWVMQYRLKRKPDYIDEYLEKLGFTKP